LVSKKHRSKILANAVAFFLLRLASLIIRAYMSRRNYSSGTLGEFAPFARSSLLILVAEAILMSIGYLPLLNALIDLWQARAAKGAVTEGLPQDVERSQRKMKWVKYVGW
jgi:hypothetical protein